MDPQTRALMEEAAKVLLDTGGEGSLSKADSKSGVYVGCMYQEYSGLMMAHGHTVTAALSTGNGISFMAGRMSYTFGLQVRSRASHASDTLLLTAAARTLQRSACQQEQADVLVLSCECLEHRCIFLFCCTVFCCCVMSTARVFLGAVRARRFSQLVRMHVWPATGPLHRHGHGVLVITGGAALGPHGAARRRGASCTGCRRQRNVAPGHNLRHLRPQRPVHRWALQDL
jgi:Beta-ketoacyl synthase, N-terminal domain